MSKESESVILKKPSHKEIPRWDGCTGEFYQMLKQKGRRGNMHFLTFHEASITDSKIDQDITKKENYRPISLMNIKFKNPQ